MSLRPRQASPGVGSGEVAPHVCHVPGVLCMGRSCVLISMSHKMRGHIGFNCIKTKLNPKI